MQPRTHNIELMNFRKLNMENLSLFAHIFNDPQLGESILQGSMFTQTIPLMCYLINLINSDDTLDDKFKKELIELKNIFDNAIYLNESNADEIMEKAYQSGFALMTGGWLGSNISNGHAMLYELTVCPDSSFIFSIYNTGAGAENHLQKVDNYVVKYLPLISLKIPKGRDKELKLVLAALQEPARQGKINKPKNKDRTHYDENELYQYTLSSLFMIDGVEIIKETNQIGKKMKYIDLQLSGTCAWFVLMTYAQIHLSEKHFQEFDYRLKRNVLKMIENTEKDQAILGMDITRKQLNDAIKNYSQLLTELSNTENKDRFSIDIKELENNYHMIENIKSLLDYKPEKIKKMHGKIKRHKGYALPGLMEEESRSINCVNTCAVSALDNRYEFTTCKNENYKQRINTPVSTKLASNKIDSLKEAFSELSKIADEYLHPYSSEITYHSFSKSLEKQLLSIKYNSDINKKSNNVIENITSINHILDNLYTILYAYIKGMNKQQPNSSQYSILQLIFTLILKLCETAIDKQFAECNLILVSTMSEFFEKAQASLFSATYNMKLDERIQESLQYLNTIKEKTISKHSDRKPLNAALNLLFKKVFDNDEYSEVFKTTGIKKYLSKEFYEKLNDLLIMNEIDTYLSNARKLILSYKEKNADSLITQMPIDEFSYFAIFSIQPMNGICTLKSNFKPSVELFSRTLAMFNLISTSLCKTDQLVEKNFFTDPIRYVSTDRRMHSFESNQSRIEIKYPIRLEYNLDIHLQNQYNKICDTIISDIVKKTEMIIPVIHSSNNIQVETLKDKKQITKDTAISRSLLHLSIKNETRIAGLYDFYYDNLTYFDNEDFRIFFLLNLFHQDSLSKLAKREPEILDKLIELIQGGYSYSMRNDHANVTTCFFLDLAFYMRSYCSGLLVKNNLQKLDEIQGNIQKLIDINKNNNNQMGLQLKLHISQFFMISNKIQEAKDNINIITAEMIAKLFASMIYINIYNNEELIYPQLRVLIDQNIGINSTYLLNWLKHNSITSKNIFKEEFAKLILAQVKEITGNRKIKDVKQMFNYLEFVDSSRDTIYYVDILLGNSYTNNGSLRVLPHKFYDGNKILEKTFGKQQIIANISKDNNSAEFIIGEKEYRCLSNANILETKMLINHHEEWYRFTEEIWRDLNTNSLPYTIMDDNYSAWECRKSNGSFSLVLKSTNPELRDYVYDSTDMRFREIDKNGNLTGFVLQILQVSEEKAHGEYKLYNIEEVSDPGSYCEKVYKYVTRFEDPRFIECLENNTQSLLSSKIFLPRYGIELISTYRRGDIPVYYLAGKAGYELDVQIRNVDNYPFVLSFKHPEGMRISLIPIQQYYGLEKMGSEEYYQFIFDKSCLIKSNNGKKKITNINVDYVRKTSLVNQELYSTYEINNNDELVPLNAHDQLYLIYLHLCNHRYEKAFDELKLYQIKFNHEAESSAIKLMENIIFNIPNTLGNQDIYQTLKYSSPQPVAIQMKIAAVLCMKKEYLFSPDNINKLASLNRRYIKIKKYLPEKMLISPFEELTILRKICFYPEVDLFIPDIRVRRKQLENELKIAEIETLIASKTVKENKSADRLNSRILDKAEKENLERESRLSTSLNKSKQYEFAVNQYLSSNTIKEDIIIDIPDANALPRTPENSKSGKNRLDSVLAYSYDLAQDETIFLDNFHYLLDLILDDEHTYVKVIDFAKKYLISYFFSPLYISRNAARPIDNNMINCCIVLLAIHENKKSASNTRWKHLSMNQSFHFNQYKWLDTFLAKSKSFALVNPSIYIGKEKYKESYSPSISSSNEKASYIRDPNDVRMTYKTQSENLVADSIDECNTFINSMPEELKEYIYNQHNLILSKSSVHKSDFSSETALYPYYYESDEVFVQNMNLLYKLDYLCGKKLNEIDNKINNNSIMLLKDATLRLQLGNSITIKSQELETRLTELKNDIISLSKTEPTKASLQLKYKIFKTSVARQDISFNEMLYFYLIDSPELMAKFTSLDESRIQQLFLMITRYLLSATFYNQLERLHKSLEGAKKLKENSPEFNRAIIDIGLNLSRTQNLHVKSQRELLMFEYLSNVTLYDEQVVNIKKMFSTETHKLRFNSQVIKVIMGGGKTTKITPNAILLKATTLAVGTNLVVVEFLPSLFATGARALLDLSSGINHKGHIFLFSRNSDNTSAYKLKEQYKLFRLIMKNRQFVITTPESVKSLECKYIELLISDHDLSIEQYKQIRYLEKILILFRRHADVIIDEGHEALAIRKELNYTIGAEHPYKKEYLQAITDLYKFINLCFVVLTFMNEKDEAQIIFKFKVSDLITGQVAYPSPEYSQQMYEQLVDALLENEESPLKNIFPQLKEKIILIKQFIFNQQSDISELGKTLSPEIMEILSLYKGEIGKLLPLTLNRHPHEHFGFPLDLNSPSNERDIAMPYSGNMKPKPESKFGNTEETINYTIQLHLKCGIPPDHVLIDFIEKFKMEATNQRIQANYKIQEDSTDACMEFFKLTGMNLSDIKSDQQSILKAIDTFHKINNKQIKDNLMYYCLNNHILVKIQIEPKIIRMDNMNHVSQFRSVDVLSGTPDPAVFHSSIEFDPLQETLGTDGRILDMLEKKNIPLEFTDFNKFSEIYPALVQASYMTRAFIDIGALFEGTTNQTVALDIARTLEKFNKDIHYVLYYDQNDNLLALPVSDCHKHDFKPIELVKTDKDYLKTMLPGFPDKCFTYYDQIHTVGVDILQMLLANAIVTLNDKNTSNDFWQGCMRMRDLPFSQTIGIVCHSSLKKAHPEIQDVSSLFKMLNKNQINKQAEEHPFAIIKEMRNCIRNELLELIFSLPISDVKLKQTYIKEFHSYFVLTQQTTFYEKYGSIEKDIDTISYINQLMTDILNDYKAYHSKLNIPLNENNIKRLHDELKAITARTSQTCFSKSKVSVNGFDQSEVTTEKQSQKQVQVQLQNQIQREVSNQKTMIIANSINNWWEKHYISDIESGLKSVDQFISSMVDWQDLIALRKFLNKSEIINSSHFNFSQNIYITHNAAYPVYDISACLSNYRNRFSWLMAFQKDKSLYFIILNEEEVSGLTNLIHELQLAQNTYAWIQSSKGTCIAGIRPDETRLAENYYYLLEQIMFLNADINDLITLSRAGKLKWLIDNNSAKKMELLDTVIINIFPDKEYSFPILDNLIREIVKKNPIPDHNIITEHTLAVSIPHPQHFNLKQDLELLINLLAEYKPGFFQHFSLSLLSSSKNKSCGHDYACASNHATKLQFLYNILIDETYSISYKKAYLSYQYEKAFLLDNIPGEFLDHWQSLIQQIDVIASTKLAEFPRSQSSEGIGLDIKILTCDYEMKKINDEAFTKMLEKLTRELKACLLAEDRLRNKGL